jgi:hypothetical protein
MIASFSYALVPFDRHSISQMLFHLVLASSGLARLELVKVPAADSKVALVLVHAAPEVGHVLRADAGSLVLGVHGGLAVGVLRQRLVDRRSGCAGSTAEPATDSVADGRADSNTARNVR